MKSIISSERKCLRCQSTIDLHKHHVFYGSANRKLSEKYGCWIYLCARHHNMSDEGVHFDRDFDLEMKKLCQGEWEATFGNRAEFIRIFGKSYL